MTRPSRSSGARSKRRALASLPRSRTMGFTPFSRQRNAANIPAGPHPTITTVRASGESGGADQRGGMSGAGGTSRATSRRSCTLMALWRASIECLRKVTPPMRSNGTPRTAAAASRRAASSSDCSRGSTISTVWIGACTAVMEYARERGISRGSGVCVPFRPL